MSTFLEYKHFLLAKNSGKGVNVQNAGSLEHFSASAKVRGHAENITREAPPPTRTSTHLRPPHLPRQRHRARNPPSPPARTHPRSPRRRPPPDSTTARPSRAARERDACRERISTRQRRAGFPARARARGDQADGDGARSARSRPRVPSPSVSLRYSPATPRSQISSMFGLVQRFLELIFVG